MFSVTSLDLLPDNCCRLDFDHGSRAGEAHHGDQGAGRIAAGIEVLSSNLDESVAVADILNVDGHRYDIGQCATVVRQALFDQAEDFARLCFEVA